MLVMSESDCSDRRQCFHERFISESKEKHRRLALLDEEIVPESDGMATETIDWLRVKSAAESFHELVSAGPNDFTSNELDPTITSEGSRVGSRRSSFNDDNLVAFFGHDKELREELKKVREERRLSVSSGPVERSSSYEESYHNTEECRSRSLFEAAQAQARINTLQTTLRVSEMAVNSKLDRISLSEQSHEAAANLQVMAIQSEAFMSDSSTQKDLNQVVDNLKQKLLESQTATTMAESKLQSEREKHAIAFEALKLQMDKQVQQALAELQAEKHTNAEAARAESMRLAEHKRLVAEAESKFERATSKLKDHYERKLRDADMSMKILIKEKDLTLEKIRIEQQGILNSRLREQEEKHKLAIKEAVRAAVERATSSLREKYERDMKETVVGGKIEVEKFSKLIAEYRQLESENKSQQRMAKAEADAKSAQVADLERSLKASLDRNESLVKSLNQEEERARKVILERSIMEADMAKERADHADQLRKQQEAMLKSISDARSQAEKEARLEMRVKQAEFDLSVLREERDSAKVHADNLEKRVEELNRKSDEDQKRILLQQDQAIRAKKLAEEHHLSKAANVRQALREERARARTLKGSHTDTAKKLAKSEAELTVLRKQLEKVSKEARSARAAAKASFEANEHSEHGVMAHAIKAKQATVEILQEQLLQQQHAHMKFARDAALQQQKLQASHASTCKRMERDYAKALKAAQAGSQRQIDNLISQIGEDAQDVQERRFMVAKRHQDQLQRMQENHQREVNDLNARLEVAMEKCRLLQTRSSVFAADLEEAATAGMLHIANTLAGNVGVQEITGTARASVLGDGRETGNGAAESSFVRFMDSPALDQKYDDPLMSKVASTSGERGRRSNMLVNTSTRSFELHTPISLNSRLTPGAAASSNGRQERNLLSLSTPSPPATSRSGSSFGRDAADSSVISDALYRSQLDIIAVRSKTEDILMRARKRMAEARAKEEGLKELMSQLQDS